MVSKLSSGRPAQFLPDFAEQAVFDGVPLRRGRGVVSDGHAQAVAVAEAMLQCWLDAV